MTAEYADAMHQPFYQLRGVALIAWFTKTYPKGPERSAQTSVVMISIVGLPNECVRDRPQSGNRQLISVIA